MWTSADNAVYIDCYNKLIKSPIINDVVDGRVYDTVQKNAVYPYIIVGETNITNNESSTNMTETIGLTIHCYSQAYNQFEVKEILNRIGYLINRKTDLDDFVVEWVKIDTREVIIDIDEYTKHGVIRFLFKVRHKTKF